MGSKVNLSGVLRNNQPMKHIIKKFFHRSSCLLDSVPGENVREALLIPYQDEPFKRKRKVSIIGGGGNSGSIMGYTLLLKNYVDEIVLVDVPQRKDKLCAEGFDLIHGTAMHKCPKIKICMDYEKTKDSDIIIFNSNGGKEDFKKHSRLDMAKSNIKHIGAIVPKVAKLSPDSVLIIATNPSELMSYTAWKCSGFNKNRIIGTGTELDSSRFRYHISRRLGINPYSVKGWIIGEHGNSSVAAWSTVSVAGTRLREIDPCIGTKNDKNCWNELHQQVIKDGPMVFIMKGATTFALCQVVNNIVRAVLCNYRTIHSVSVCLKGLYGIKTDCYLSFPCVIGNRGVSEIVQLCLEDDEVDALVKSADALDKHAKSMEFPCET